LLVVLVASNLAYVPFREGTLNIEERFQGDAICAFCEKELINSVIEEIKPKPPAV